jgi:hypothetical protein
MTIADCRMSNQPRQGQRNRCPRKEAELKFREDTKAHQDLWEDRMQTGRVRAKKRKGMMESNAHQKDNRPRCGRYNFRGCTQDGCRFAHVYDPNARRNYLDRLKKNKGEDFVKNAIANWKFQGDFPQEAQEYGEQMYEDVGEPDRPLFEDDKDEEEPPELTKEERIAELKTNLKQEQQKLVDEAMVEFEDNGDALGARIVELTQKLVLDTANGVKKIEDEFKERERNCYQLLEREFASKAQRSTPQYKHKFEIIKPGSLGKFTHQVTAENLPGIKKLTDNLVSEMYVQHTKNLAVADFNCTYCMRGLAIPFSGYNGSSIVTCRVCFGALYCSTYHRKQDAFTHQFGCTRHPGWLAPTKEELDKLRSLEPKGLPEPYVAPPLQADLDNMSVALAPEAMALQAEREEVIVYDKEDPTGQEADEQKGKRRKTGDEDAPYNDDDDSA